MEIPTPAIFCLLYIQKEKSSTPFGQSQVNATLSSSGALDKNLWLAFDLLFLPPSFNALFFHETKEREDEQAAVESYTDAALNKSRCHLKKKSNLEIDSMFTVSMSVRNVYLYLWVGRYQGEISSPGSLLVNLIVKYTLY